MKRHGTTPRGVYPDSGQDKHKFLTNGQPQNLFYAYTRADASLIMLLGLPVFFHGQEHIISSLIQTPLLTISVCLYIALLWSSK